MLSADFPPGTSVSLCCGNASCRIGIALRWVARSLSWTSCLSGSGALNWPSPRTRISWTILRSSAWRALWCHHEASVIGPFFCFTFGQVTQDEIASDGVVRADLWMQYTLCPLLQPHAPAPDSGTAHG